MMHFHCILQCHNTTSKKFCYNILIILNLRMKIWHCLEVRQSGIFDWICMILVFYGKNIYLFCMLFTQFVTTLFEYLLFLSFSLYIYYEYVNVYECTCIYIYVYAYTQIQNSYIHNAHTFFKI